MGREARARAKLGLPPEARKPKETRIRCPKCSAPMIVRELPSKEIDINHAEPPCDEWTATRDNCDIDSPYMLAVRGQYGAARR